MSYQTCSELRAAIEKALSMYNKKTHISLVKSSQEKLSNIPSDVKNDQKMVRQLFLECDVLIQDLINLTLDYTKVDERQSLRKLLVSTFMQAYKKNSVYLANLLIAVIWKEYDIEHPEIQPNETYDLYVARNLSGHDDAFFEEVEENALQKKYFKIKKEGVLDHPTVRADAGLPPKSSIFSQLANSFQALFKRSQPESSEPRSCYGVKS